MVNPALEAYLGGPASVDRPAAAANQPLMTPGWPTYRVVPAREAVQRLVPWPR
jgi:hypothetical protein